MGRTGGLRRRRRDGAARGDRVASALPVHAHRCDGAGRPPVRDRTARGRVGNPGMTQPIPRYWESVDWAALERDYPPPPEYAMSHGRLSADELAALQERRVLERIGQAWQAPFYRKRWTEAGLAPGDIRGLDDLDRIPTFTSDDLKE